MRQLLYCLFLVLTFPIAQLCYGQIPTDPYEEEDTLKIVRSHVPGSGFRLINKPDGVLTFSAYASTRYLNQTGLDDNYTDAFGRTKNIDKRNDLQFQKVMLYFKGWLFDPKFRYLLYVWTSNTSQGQGAQVVLGGNFQYQFNKHLDVGVGIGGLPTNRSMYGQFPGWLRMDARNMTEEFFRGSFTTGIWVQGEIFKNMYYRTMLGNNLSQLGIDAGQLDGGFDTWSSGLWHTTNNYGRMGPYGDFERHNSLATLLGASYSRSNETRQSQPDSEAPENSQIRLSDGTGLFAINAFDTDASVLSAKYEMVNITGGLKWKGFSFDADYFLRWVSKLETTGPIPVDQLFDHGLSLQGSSMLLDKTLQAYLTGAFIFGEYGDPTEFNLGLNWFPFKNKSFRVNAEYIRAYRSPVGYASFPTQVGANGNVFMINLELFY
ncbi:hypothetical protein KJS94_11535 [Flavihumibacter rivuli]|uniref:hypothetical protein n=1 Tax=Flavihumibacter rivuli TaxID=2838156 RepID=UPI001BDEE1F3|nr:hypothetical protein [Flavihumibacter rivuli]ULQ55273.1 hypothetical protein KJS94_11535 [Flavihumibacter rivuli]